MSARITLATAERVLRQLVRDHRTLALVLVVPPVLLVLFRYVFDSQEATFDRLGGPMVGLFPFITMFLVTSIAMLRERTTGTLERLMSLPLAKAISCSATRSRSRPSRPCRRCSPRRPPSGSSGSTRRARCGSSSRSRSRTRCSAWRSGSS